jgi:uncharacterized protein (DUF2235 family)
MRRLVVCADGTWKSRDDIGDAANVEKLADAVLPVTRDVIEQVVGYFPGVGSRNWERLRGGAFGVGLSRNVKDAYRWLVTQWTEPSAGAGADEIYLFGFSRGAFTVRSLAGLIRNVGLVEPGRPDLVDEAYRHYRDRSPEWRADGAASVAFRRRSSREVPYITCIGVWDTVGALGVPTRGPLGWLTRRRWGFHDVQLSGRVQSAFHALALDEQRRAFAPTVWRADDADAHRQRVEQVWFPGSHSNVGGGYADCTLSDITLQWMAERAGSCGLELGADRLGAVAPDAFEGTLNDSRTRLYKLQRPLVREICAEPLVVDGRTLRTHESVSEAALQRHRKCTRPPRGPYAPANVVAYLQRTG